MMMRRRRRRKRRTKQISYNPSSEVVTVNLQNIQHGNSLDDDVDLDDGDDDAAGDENDDCYVMKLLVAMVT